MIPWLSKFNKTRAQLRSQPISQGFTIVELLVSLAIAGILLAATGGIITNILRTDQREAANGAVQAETQQTLDFIRRDLENAVYVYTGEEIQNQIIGTGFYNPPDRTIVLAFWKNELVEECVNDGGAVPAACNATAGDPTNGGLGNLTQRRSALTLVMYAWDLNDTAAWPQEQFGEGKIVRIEVPPIRGNEQRHPSYISPDPNDIADWPYEAGVPGLDQGASPINPVMGHIVRDLSNPNFPPYNPPPVDCGAFGPDFEPSPDAGGAPSFANAYYSFYACVIPAEDVGPASSDQEVIITIRPDAAGKAAGAFNPDQNVEPLVLRTFTRAEFGRTSVAR